MTDDELLNDKMEDGEILELPTICQHCGDAAKFITESTEFYCRPCMLDELKER